MSDGIFRLAVDGANPIVFIVDLVVLDIIVSRIALYLVLDILAVDFIRVYS